METKEGTRFGVPIRDQIRGCPRNCERLDLRKMRHWETGKTSVKSTIRKPGDLPLSMGSHEGEVRTHQL